MMDCMGDGGIIITSCVNARGRIVPSKIVNLRRGNKQMRSVHTRKRMLESSYGFWECAFRHQNSFCDHEFH